MAAHPMPALPLFFLTMNLGAVILAISPRGGRLAAQLPLGALVAFQGFRLPLELVLHSWSEQGTIPSTMTWIGRNWDIASGALALLLNVMRVAVLSSPLPFAWKVMPPLQIGLRVPYFLIVPVCVGGALAGHLILTRKLLHPVTADRAGP